MKKVIFIILCAGTIALSASALAKSSEEQQDLHTSSVTHAVYG